MSRGMLRLYMEQKQTTHRLRKTISVSRSVVPCGVRTHNTQRSGNAPFVHHCFCAKLNIKNNYYEES